MPSKQSRARHAAPRDPSRTRAILPGLLLAAAGTAFAGLAAMPTAAAAPVARVTVAQALAPVELPSMQIAPAPTANRALLDALQKGSDIADAPVPVAAPAPVAVPIPAAETPVDPRLPAKASRDRSAAAAPGGGDFVRPGNGRLTSGYGRRWGRLHAGIDLAAGTGSPIRAVASGTVIASGSEGGYGNCIRIQHADGSVSLYGHMSSLGARRGAKVAAGEQIGREGNTGQSTGPHLHFEIRINDIPINPVPWLAKHGINV